MASSEVFDFDAQWPLLSRHLYELLARRGLPTYLADEIVQETALRLWDRRAQIDSTRPIEALANTIALNLWRDFRRRQKFLSPDNVPADIRAPIDVETEVCARDELNRVRRALGRLNPRYRRILLAAAGDFGTPGGQVPASVRMMKMRARAALRALAEDVTRLHTGLGVAIHRFSNSLRARSTAVSSRSEWVTAAAAAAAMLLVVPTSMVPSAPDAPDVPEAAPRVSFGGSVYLAGSSTSAYGPEWEIVHTAHLDPREDKLKKPSLSVGLVDYYEGDSIGSGTIVVRSALDAAEALPTLRARLGRVCPTTLLRRSCRETTQKG